MKSRVIPPGEFLAVQSQCGPMEVVTTAEDSPQANVARLLASQNGRPHWHEQTVEYYLVLAGLGHIRIGEHNADPQDFLAQPGSLILIQTGEIHQVRPWPGGLFELLVMAAPAWQPDDELFLLPLVEQRFAELCL